MSNLKFFINAEEIAAEFQHFKVEVEEALTESVKALAASTHAKAIEIANKELHSRRQTYLDNLNFEEVTPGLWVVSLDEPAMWIEEGRKSGSMVEDLLRHGAKTAKDGSRYKSIPFDHGKSPANLTPFGRQMVTKIKSSLKSFNVPFKKIEYNKDGSPRLGKLHTLDIPSPKPTSRASTPALFGVSVYQSQGANGKVRRDILTFRTVSSKHEGSKWIHPGLEGEKILDQALAWAEKTFESEILPQIYERFGK